MNKTEWANIDWPELLKVRKEYAEWYISMLKERIEIIENSKNDKEYRHNVAGCGRFIKMHGQGLMDIGQKMHEDYMQFTQYQ